MAIPIIYGIANCDTVKKARRWLDEHLVKHQFHDFRRDGLTAAQLKAWFAKIELEVLLNKRSRTWRELAEKDKSNVTQAKAIKLMLDQPSLIKRPVLVMNTQVMVGFDAAHYESLFVK